MARCGCIEAVTTTGRKRTLTVANAPLENGQVGLFGGAVGSGQVVSVDVSSWITGNGTYTAIVKLDTGGNDVWFGSEESARKPQLIVETGDGGSPSYQLTVNNGSGTGSYPAGAVVGIVADAPPSGQEFDQWTGDTGTVADVNAASTTMTMPTGDATVTASYQAVSGGGTFSFGPSDDAYLQGSTRFNDAYLKVEAGYRASYLKFSVGGCQEAWNGRRCGCRRTGIWGVARCGCIEAVTTTGRKRR